MPIINVNSFQNGISKSNYLTSYTDAYLKQSLANLGQRTASKGDSIGFSSFSIQDLFPNYTGDFNEDNLLVQLLLYPDENKVIGYLRLLQEDGSFKSLSELEANSKFEVDNINNVIRNLSDEYDEDNITLSDTQQINNVDYWHKESATFCKTSNSLIYKLVGHKSSGVYSAYDNEYICEEVLDDGTFVEGFRIFIINENNLMQTETPDASGPSSEKAHERLCLVHLHKNTDTFTDTLKEHAWVLDVYKVREALNDGTNPYYIGLGDAEGLLEDSRIDELIAEFADSSNSGTPSTVISNIVDTIVNGSALNTLSGMITKLYSVPVDFNTESNAYWSVPETFVEKHWKWMSDTESFSGTYSGQLAADSDLNTGITADIDIIKGNTLVGTNGKLEYFASDVSQLYPRVLSVYNEVMYKSTSNIKMKERMISSLMQKCWKSSINSQENPDTTALYVMYLPTDYEFKYNCNSNDGSIIYNMTSSIPVQFDYINDTTNTTVTAVENNVKFLKKIVHVDGSDTEKYIFANNYTEFTILYDMNIEYSELDDTVITNINWSVNFIMPYISSNGYWVVNGIETTNYAKGISNDAANLITIISDDLYTFQPSKKILSGVGIDTLQALDGSSFEKKVFQSNYIDTSVNVGGANTFDMQAWVPSDEYIASVRNTDVFSYLSNAIIMNVCSTSLEKDATYIQYAYYDGSSVLHPASTNVIGDSELVTTTYTTGKYNKETYEDWAIGSDENNSYIYRIATKANTIESLVGGTGMVTSFWTCSKHKDYDTNTTYYSFDYVKNPSTGTALDFNYICNLEQYIKYYSKNSFSPDDYEHTQLVFDPVIQLLKNNTNNTTSRVWPVILNHNAEYYNPTMGEDVTRGIGMASDIADQQYYNSMNLAVEFLDSVKWNSNQKISSTDNTLDNKRFHFSSYTVSYLENYSYYGIYYDEQDTDKKFPKIGLANGTIEREVTYGVIPKVINYTNFEDEYIPNSEYTPNGALGNQYPSIDLKETTLRNVNTWNRTNFLIADKVNFNSTTSYGVIYNAYIGSAYTDKDKSVLHIGTHNTNPNLGTTSMTGRDDIHMLTKMGKLSVDFDQIDMNGYMGVKGEIISERPSWTTTNIDGYKTFSTIMHPIDVLENKEKLESGIIPSNTNAILSNVKFIDRKKKHTRYYGIDEERNVSYLNIAKFLNDNGVPNDEKSHWWGDATLLTKRDKSVNTDKAKIYKTVANLLVNYPGVLQYKYKMFSYLDTFTTKDKETVLNDPDNGLNIDLKWTTLEKCQPTYDEWTKYSLANTCKVETNTYLYETRGTETGDLDQVESYPVISYKTNTIGDGKWTYIYDNGQRITYQVTGVAYTAYFDNTKEELDQSNNIYLELSTDLTDDENVLGYGHNDNDYKDTLITCITAANPIQVSYTDVASYETAIRKETYTYITAYMAATAYMEYWTCDGCDLCSETACPMINKCNKSKCQGYFIPSYFYTIISPDDNVEDIINDNVNNVLIYNHKRYRLAANKKDYEEYEVKSYWPITKYITRYDFDVESDFDKLTTKIENGLEKRLTYYKSTGEYLWEVISDANSAYIATSFPVGQNYICSYGPSYVASFLEEYNSKGYSCEVNAGDYSIVSYKGKDETSYTGFTFTYTYLRQYDEEVNVAGTPQTVTRTEEVVSDPIYSKFSYCDTIVGYDKMISYVRHINVRELITSHTVPEFYNERLVKLDDITRDDEKPYGPNELIPDGTNYDDKPEGEKPSEKLTVYTSNSDTKNIVISASYDSDKISIEYDGKDMSDDENAKQFAFHCGLQYKQIDKLYKVVVGLDGNLKWVYDEDKTMEAMKQNTNPWKYENLSYIPSWTCLTGPIYIDEEKTNYYTFMKPNSDSTGDPGLVQLVDQDGNKVVLTKEIVKKLAGNRNITFGLNSDEARTEYQNAPNQTININIIYKSQYTTEEVFETDENNLEWDLGSEWEYEFVVTSYTKETKDDEVYSFERNEITWFSNTTKNNQPKYFDVNDNKSTIQDATNGKWRFSVKPKSDILYKENEYTETIVIKGANNQSINIVLTKLDYRYGPK